MLPLLTAPLVLASALAVTSPAEMAAPATAEAPAAITVAAPAPAPAAHPATAATDIDLSRKTPLAEKDFLAKPEGGYVTGLPLVNSDPDRGVGYGVRAYYYNNGERADPLFRYTPYAHRLFAQYFRTTRDYEYHTVNYDAPYLGGSAYRLRAVFEYEHETFANYYGVGDASLAPLGRAGESTTYDGAPDFERANRASVIYARYNQYEYVKPQFILNLERDLLGGLVRPMGGLWVMKAQIRDYTGDTVEVDGRAAPGAQTRLYEDAQAGLIAGFDGGWVNKLSLGVAYDSRDYEPDPNRGAFHEANVFFSRRWLGSAFDFTRYLAAARYYYSPIPQTADLVLASRIAYQFVRGNAPFFELAAWPFSDNNTMGLGGLRTLRGYRATRFTGPAMALANAELRYTFYRFALGSQTFAPAFVPFVDAGRPFDGVEATRLTDFRVSGGAGLRIAWNQATIIMIDYGVSAEESGLYVNFNHAY